MELKEALEILSYERKYADKDCSCHISPPCSKCVNKPDEEAKEEAILTAISHLETLQDEKQLRIKYQDIVYQICRLFDTTEDKCRVDDIVNKVRAIQELFLGKKEE